MRGAGSSSGQTNYSRLSECRPHPACPEITGHKNFHLFPLLPSFNLFEGEQTGFWDKAVHIYTLLDDVCCAHPDFIDIVGVVDRLTEVAVPGCSGA